MAETAAGSAPLTRFEHFLRPNRRPYTLRSDEDADLVGMRLYGLGPFHRELKAAAKIQKKTHFVIHEGDVIFNKLFAWKGTFGIVPQALDGMFVSDKFPTYELDTTQVLPEFLGWYFRYPGLWEQARRLSTGSAALSKFTLNPPRFLRLLMRVPAIPIQKQVVGRLESFSSALGRVQTLSDRVRPEATALLLAYVEKRLRVLEGNYPTRTLMEVVDGARGISYGVVQTGVAQDDGVPTLRAGDVRQFEVLLDNVKEVSPAIEAKYLRTRLRGREVLLRIRGGLGEVAVCPPTMIGGNVSREVAVIPLLESMDPEFVMYAVATPSRQDFLRANVRGTSYQGINLKDVRRLGIPVPPMPIQAQFVQDVRALRANLEGITSAQAQVVDWSDALMPSLLAEAFEARPAEAGANDSGIQP